MNATPQSPTRFVVLRHELPPGNPRALHWDFMLEVEGTLRTWALDREPADGLIVRAEPLADHRLAYLDYEGPISGGRGVVARWDRGTCHIVRWEANEIRVDVAGQRLCGQVHLARSPAAGHWTVTFVAGRSATAG
ncbi:MAG: hypothetical protein HYX69_14495 [Planctomycetia bacterium]|nr:hypothetical protein [Planctomycetia bacterium]